MAALGNFTSVFNSVGKIFTPAVNNFLRWNDVKLKILQGHAVGVGKIGGRANTEEDFMRILILMLKIMTITGNY